MPNVGPWLGWRMQVNTLLAQDRPNAWLKPTVVVLLPFTQRRRRDGGHIDIFTIRNIVQTVQNFQADFGFILSVQLDF